MEMNITEFLLGFLLLLGFLYYYATATYNFWSSRGVKGPKPIPFFGTVKEIFFGRLGLGSYATKIYKNFKNEPIVGVYSRREPVLIIRDTELIKSVLIKDFRIFVNRGMQVSEKHDPLLQNLFFLDSKRWRPLRTKLTPVFTSGKIREMFYLFRECGDKLDKYLDKFNDSIANIRDITGKFTTEVIGMCAFGVHANAFEEEESAFIKMGNRIFAVNFKTFIKFIVRQFSPRLYEIVGGFLRDREMDDFFVDLAKDTMEYRKKNNVMRHDFIDLMRALKSEANGIGEDIEFTDAFVAAQLAVFFVGGSETSSTTISNCLFELTMNPSIQRKLREEIRRELEKSNGEITYEAMSKMTYLEKVVNETLRKYPPVTILSRKSGETYTLPGTDVTIPAGMKIWIPVFAIHRDEEYYPNAKVFDPERFNEEEVKKRRPMTFIPFGEGPRNCIGARFGRIQAKYGIVRILRNYTVEVCDKTDREYRIHPRAMFLAPINGIHLRIIKSSIL